MHDGWRGGDLRAEGKIVFGEVSRRVNDGWRGGGLRAEGNIVFGEVVVREPGQASWGGGDGRNVGAMNIGR